MDKYKVLNIDITREEVEQLASRAAVGKIKETHPNEDLSPISSYIEGDKYGGFRVIITCRQGSDK